MTNDFPFQRKLDKDHGLNLGSFVDALDRAGIAKAGAGPKVGSDDVSKLGGIPSNKNPMDDQRQPVDPEARQWSRAPVTEDEKALYWGVHMHTESNPLGLHTHIPGGKAAGGHGHGPQNRLGVHQHKMDMPKEPFGKPGVMLQLDGNHDHQYNHPDGGHDHLPENFG